MSPGSQSALGSVALDYSASQRKEPVLVNLSELTDDFILYLFGNITLEPANKSIHVTCPGQR